MRRSLLLSAAMLTGLTTAAVAQQPAAGIKLSDVAGVWDSKTMVGPKDSVVTTIVITATADGKGWTMAMANGKNVVPIRVVSSGGQNLIQKGGEFNARRTFATPAFTNNLGTRGANIWSQKTSRNGRGNWKEYKRI